MRPRVGPVTGRPEQPRLEDQVSIQPATAAAQGSVGTGLVRVTVVGPTRRLDLAVPEQVPLAELLPRLLVQAGDTVDGVPLPDAGEQHGGWVLCRADGSRLEPGRSLAAQTVRDGELLHLAPRRAEWPEPDYDDVADAIADAAQRYSRTWSPGATRIAGLALAACALLLGLVPVLLAGPDWLLPALVALLLATALLTAGVLLSRALSDAVAGAVLAATGLPYAFIGGLLLLGGSARLDELGASEALVGATALVVAGVAGYLGVADGSRWFVAGTTAGLAAAAGAVLGLFGLSAAGAAGVVVSAVVLAAPAYPLLAIRFGQLPLPALPLDADDLASDNAQLPARGRVYPAVVRSDEVLSGMLLGTALVAVVGTALLVRQAGTAAPLLATLVAAAMLLRSRTFPAVRHRLPHLAAGVGGLALIALGATVTASPVTRLVGVLGALVVLAVIAAAAGLTYSRRPSSPYLSRLADLVDAVLLVALVPVVCAVLDLYGYVRGLAG